MTPKPRVAFITVVATLAYLGLAILGWGSFAAFFSHPPLIALVIVGFVLTGVALFSGGNLSPGEREDKGNRWVLAAFGVIGILLAYLPAYTDRKDFWTLDGDAIRWLGVILSAAGGALRIWPVFVLGHRFSGLVAIQPGHTLVTSGVYGVIRQPQLSGLVRQLAWMGAGFSVGGRRTARGAPYSAAHCANARRGDAAAHAIRCRVRCLLRSHNEEEGYATTCVAIALPFDEE